MKNNFEKTTLLLTVISALSLVQITSVSAASLNTPNVFAAGQAATAASVNENFTAVETAVNNNDSRITTLENVTATTSGFSGYAMPFSDAGTPKNVVVLVSDDGSGGINYHIRSRYANSTEKMSVNGVQTVRDFMAHYGYVHVDTTGTVDFVNDYIEAPLTADYKNFVIEQRSYDPASLALTVTRDTQSEEWDCAGIATRICSVVVKKNGAYDHSTGQLVQRALKSAFTVNVDANTSLSFNNVRFEFTSRTGSTANQFRVRAKGIGEVYRTFDNSSNGKNYQRRVIYYRVNGVTGGTLAGTPLENNASLSGLFF